MDLMEKRLKSELIYDGAILSVRRDLVELPNGKTAYREVVDKMGAVCVVPLFDDGRVGVVNQFRYPYMAEILELPAGKLDGDEDPLTGAVRELSEETGLTAERWDYLGTMYPSVGFTNEILYLYLARGLKSGEQHLDKDEFLNYETMPLEELVDLVMGNKLPDAKSAIAVLKTKLFLEREVR